MVMKRLVCFTIAAALVAAPAYAQDSLGNVSKASGDSVVATAQLAEAGVKVVVAESGGAAIRASGQAVWDEANGPLEISPETVTAQPAPKVPYDADKR
jgi:accessory colonization factor AcfC